MNPLHDRGDPSLRRGFRGRAVIFDLDGTLIDTAPDIACAVDRTLLDLGVPAAGEERIRNWVGDGAGKLLERALQHGGSTSDADPQRAMVLFLQHYAAVFTARSRPYDGVAATLERLAAQGRSLAVCTNKPARFVQPLLRHLGLARYFAACVGGDELPARKPDPLPLLHLAGVLGIAPRDCLMVGDSRNDVAAARGAGMPVVAVSYGYNHGADIRDDAPDAVIEAMDQLLPLLEPDPKQTVDRSL